MSCAGARVGYGRPHLQKELRSRRRRIADEDRKRAPRACDRCKKRKNRCIRDSTGSCQRCHAGGYHCSLVDRDDTPAGADASSQGPLNDATLPELGQDGQSVETTDHTPRQQTEVMAMANDIALTPSDSSGWAGFLARLREAFCLEPPKMPEAGTARVQSLDSTVHHSAEEQARARAAISRFPPLSIARFLVTVCIEHGTDCFFYFDQARFVADLEELYANEASHSRDSASFVCLALAVFALGSQWTTLAKPSGRAPTPPQEGRDPGRLFYDQARLLIGDVVDSSSFAAVQAAFVLGVYLMPASAISAAYIYMGLALRKAMALDLHREPTDPTIPEADRESRRRLWWALYSLERTTTVKLNRPSSVQLGQISAELPRDCHLIDAAQIFDNLLLQKANAELVMILDELSSLPSSSYEERLPLEMKLKRWKRSLPVALRRENIPAKSSYYRAATHVYLNYYFAWIAMGKVSVVTVARAQLSSCLRPGQSPINIDDDVSTLAQSCIKSAKKMLRLFEDLHRTGNITRFSFTDFQGCSIATIVLLVAGVISAEQDCQAMASDGLHYLSLMAGRNPTALKGVHFVEAVQAIVAEAVAKVDASRTQSAETTTRVPGPDASDYTQWAQWLSTVTPMETGTTSRPDQGDAWQEGRNALYQSGRRQAQRSVPPTPPSVSGLFPADWAHTTPISQQRLQPTNVARDVSTGGVMQDLANVERNQDSIMVSEFQNVFENDHDYLMGLTGLGVLNFTEQADMGFDFSS